MLFNNFRISLCGRSHGSRRRTEWMTVTAMLETAEAGKSGDIKVPHVAVAVFCKLGTWADTPRSESSQLHRRCCQKCDGHCVTGNVYSSSCVIMWATRKPWSGCLTNIWSWWACETDFEQRQRLWYIEWKSTIRYICIQTIRLRRLTVLGTVLKPQLSIITDLGRPCNNPWKESLIVWGDIYMWHLRCKKFKQVGENATWKYKSWPANNSSRTGLVMQDGHRIRCPG